MSLEYNNERKLAIEINTRLLRRVTNIMHIMFSGLVKEYPWSPPGTITRHSSKEIIYPHKDSGLLLRNSGICLWSPSDFRVDGTFHDWAYTYVAPCFRMDDLHGKENHLVMFNMFGFLGCTKLEEDIKSMRDGCLARFLDLCFPRTKSGGIGDWNITIEANEDDLCSVERIIKQGIYVKTPDEPLIWKANNYPTGKSLEVYIDGVEVANFVIFHLQEYDMYVLDIGIGVERFASTVFCPPSGVYNEANEMVPFDKVLHKKYNILQAVLTLMNNGEQVDNKGRGYLLRKLIRTMYTTLPDPSDLSLVASILYPDKDMSNHIITILEEYLKCSKLETEAIEYVMGFTDDLTEHQAKIGRESYGFTDAMLDSATVIKDNYNLKIKRGK